MGTVRRKPNTLELLITELRFTFKFVDMTSRQKNIRPFRLSIVDYFILSKRDRFAPPCPTLFQDFPLQQQHHD